MSHRICLYRTSAAGSMPPPLFTAGRKARGALETAGNSRSWQVPEKQKRVKAGWQ